MPAIGLVDNMLRNLVEHVPTALAQAVRFLDQAGQILEALFAAQRDLRGLDDLQCERLVEAALAPSVSPELRRRVARGSDAMKNLAFFGRLVQDAGSDPQSLQILRDLEVRGLDERRLDAMLRSGSVAVREVGARLAIQTDRFLIVAAATLVHEGNAEVLRGLAARSKPGSALREAHALAEIMLASRSTASDAAKALEAVGSTPSWLSESPLDPALGPVGNWPCGNLAQLHLPFHRAKITLLTLIDALRPDLAVPILVGWKPAFLLEGELERLWSAPAFVGLLAQTQPDVAGELVGELCALFGSGAAHFRVSSPLAKEDVAHLLPGFLSGVLTKLSHSTLSTWVNLRESCPYADLSAVERSFLESAAGSVAMKLAALDQRLEAVEAFRAWFERAAGAEEWDGLLAVLALHHGGLSVDAVWPRVSTEMAALMAAATWESDLTKAWESDPTTLLMPRPDLPEILAQVAGCPASAHVRALALAGARRCGARPPVRDPAVLTLALMRSVRGGRLPADEWPYVVELFAHSDDELLAARPSISRFAAIALDTAAELGQRAAPVTVERLARLCFTILRAQRVAPHDPHDGACCLAARVWQEDNVLRRQLVETLAQLAGDHVDALIARMPPRLAEKVASSSVTPPRIRAHAVLRALDSADFDPKRCDVSGEPETIARAFEGFKESHCSNFKTTAEYLVRASINALVRRPPAMSELDEQSSPWFRVRERLRDILSAFPELATFASGHLAEALSGVLRDFVKNGIPTAALPHVACWIRAAGKLQDPRPLSVLRQHASALAKAGFELLVDEVLTGRTDTLAANVRVILSLRELRMH